jgi:hypothetical protein
VRNFKGGKMDRGRKRFIVHCINCASKEPKTFTPAGFIRIVKQYGKSINLTTQEIKLVMDSKVKDIYLGT